MINEQELLHDFDRHQRQINRFGLFIFFSNNSTKWIHLISWFWLFNIIICILSSKSYYIVYSICMIELVGLYDCQGLVELPKVSILARRWALAFGSGQRGCGALFLTAAAAAARPIENSTSHYKSQAFQLPGESHGRPSDRKAEKANERLSLYLSVIQSVCYNTHTHGQ